MRILPVAALPILIPLVLAGAALGHHQPENGTLSGKATAAASWTWLWHRPSGGAITAPDGGALLIEWSETYEAGARVRAFSHVSFVGVLGDADCRIWIDDVAGTYTAQGEVNFTHGLGAVPCTGGGSGEGRPDDLGICWAAGIVYGLPEYEGTGSGHGPCEESVGP